MWTASLSTLAALLSLQFTSASATITCHSDYPLRNWFISDLSKLQEAFVDPVADLCSKGSDHGTGKVITHGAGGVTFKITRTTAQNQEECNISFAKIITQCISAQTVDGGEVEGTNGAIYSIYNESLEREDLEEFYLEERNARNLQDEDTDENNKFGDLLEIVGRGKLDTRGKPKAKPKTKPKTKPITKPKQKPKLKMTKSGTNTHSATSSLATAGPTKACKAIYAEAINEMNAEALEIEETGIGKRTTTKTGTSCGDAFNALAYPQVNDMPASAKFYGFSQPVVCENVVFPAGSSIRPIGMTQADYQIEHVLEWQVVTKFFDWISENKKKGKIFDSPRPKASTKLTFCEYWKATWDSANSPPKFQLNNQGESRFALDHIRYAYPSDGQFIDEFIYLQTAVNSPAKATMWAYFKKPKPGVYSTTTSMDWRGRGAARQKVPSRGISDLITGHAAKGGVPATPANINDARVALLKLKWLMGARMYLRKAAVEAIFKKQVNRIGVVLAALDTEMETQVKKPKVGAAWAAWKRQGLKELWDEYMIEKFETAKSRCTHDMDTYIRLLDQKWAPKGQASTNRDRSIFYAQVQKLKKAWAAEKARTWTAPWKKYTHPANPPTGTSESI